MSFKQCMRGFAIITSANLGMMAFLHGVIWLSVVLIFLATACVIRWVEP